MTSSDTPDVAWKWFKYAIFMFAICSWVVLIVGLSFRWPITNGFFAVLGYALAGSFISWAIHKD